MVSYVATPSSPRHVSFMPIPVYSRQCHDDELYVLKTFEKHASHCSYCLDPLNTHRSRSTLCAKGHAKAIDVAQYVYSKEGLAYSLVDRKAHQRVRLEIPPTLKSVKSLLAAWEEGMKLLQPVKREKTYDTPRKERKEKMEKVRPARIDTTARPVYHTRPGSASSPDYDYSYNYADGYSTSPTYYYSDAPYHSPRQPSVVYRVAPASPPMRQQSYYPR